MKASKSYQSAYTIAPLSARLLGQHKNQEQITYKTSTRGTSCSKLQDVKLSSPRDLVEDVPDQPSDLNSSGANSTIHEYVKMLTTNDQVATQEDSVSLSSSYFEAGKDAPRIACESIENKRRSKDDHGSESAPYRTKSINFMNFPAKHKEFPSASKKDISETQREFPDLSKFPELEKDKENTLNPKKSLGLEPSPNTFFSKCGGIIERRNSKQSISKIARGSSDPHNMAINTASNLYLSLKGDSNVTKRFDTAPSTSRPLSSRTLDGDIYQGIKAFYSLTTSQAAQVAAQTVQKKETKAKLAANSFTSSKSKRGLSSRNSYCSNTGQTLNKNAQKKPNPCSISISRTLQAIVTSRRDYHSQRGESQPPLAPIEEEKRKQIEKKSQQVKPENKTKFEGKSLKSAHVDLVEFTMSLKNTKRKREEEKVDEYTKHLEQVFEKLKKVITEKKGEVAHSENCLQRLRNLNTYMDDTVNLINNLN